MTGDQLVVQQGLPTKRVKGIEPSPKAWEAFVLPLNYTREWAYQHRRDGQLSQEAGLFA